mgnify:CR=1 FL=1
MSDPLIRRSRSSCATQADIISFDIRFIPVEHTHSLVPKSPQLWLWPRAFCGVTNMASKSGMRIGRQQCRPCSGRRHTTVITLPIPKSAPARCIAWGIAVDATLVDSRIRDVRMPTDFDDFTPAAMLPYMGSSFEIRGHCAFAAVRYAHGWFLRLTH